MLLNLRFALYPFFFQFLRNLRLRFIKFLKKVAQFALYRFYFFVTQFTLFQFYLFIFLRNLCLRFTDEKFWLRRLRIKIFYLRAHLYEIQ